MIEAHTGGERHTVASVNSQWRDDVGDQKDNAQLIAEAPSYHAAAEAIRLRVLEAARCMPGARTIEGVLAVADAIQIPSALLKGLLAAHARANKEMP
jgi:hypothetical protein